MRIVIQRVKESKVIAEGKLSGSIGVGLLVFLGIHKDDSVNQIPWFVNKLINLRIFQDEQGKMNLSVKDIGGEILVVSQFTLYANCSRGRRPDFLDAAPSSIAIPLYEEFINAIKKEVKKVETGIFGASMEVFLVNDGPITLVLEDTNPTCYL